MIVSWNWLREYVALDVPREELERRLMMSGLNHEETQAVDDDFAIDLEVTSNRPDCLGHLGIAREAAVLCQTPLKTPAASPAETGPPVAELTSVAIECPDLCERYTARVIQGVKIAESPAWMRRRLETIGVKPISNIVDATNYVMMECGQPLHAFDMDKLAGGRIVVREPKPGEKLEAIDHTIYELAPGMCVIADAQRPVGLGGVMGGAETEIADGTTNVLIEAAQFSPLSIRNTARRLKLFSPSSYRFERGLDPCGVDWASRRCCELILEASGGSLARGVVDVGARPPARSPVTLRLNQLQRILGIEIDAEEALRILLALGNEQRSADAGRIEVIPPSWRRDLTREIDLVEEVGRIHGYDNIPEDVSVPMAASARSNGDRMRERLRCSLGGAGFNEAMTLSAVTAEQSAAVSPWTDRPPLTCSPAIIKGADTLRRSLIPSLLTARQTNEALGNPHIELYEIAKVYLPGDAALPEEAVMLGVTSGRDFFSLKGALEAVVADISPDVALRPRATRKPFFGERCAELYLEDDLLGFLGEVAPDVAEAFGLRKETTVAELRLELLERHANLVRQYVKPPEYPAITHDVNLEVSDDVPWDTVAEVVRTAGGPLVEELRYQETYRNRQLADAGQKRVLFSVAFRSGERTLTHDEANEIHARIVQACEEKLEAQLR